MANAAVDWTVDKLLSGVATLNAKMEHAQGTIRANRANYMATLRSLPSIPDVQAREAVRAQLAAWIPKQVDAENRFNALSQAYTVAKAKVKAFLQSVGVTPPGSLGGPAVAVPVLIWGAIAAGLVTVGVIITLAIANMKALECITNVSTAARNGRWTAAQTADALRTCKAAAPVNDPLGLAALLEKALPVIVVVGALYLFGPMLKRKFA